MILPIILYRNIVLRNKASEVTFGSDITSIVSNMFETVNKALGCGLAAPQVGKSEKFFIVNYADENDEVYEKVFINPKIVVNEGKIVSYTEGCLSLPNVEVTVDRIEDVTITYFDINWQTHTERYQGFMARIIQHEYDHLLGKLIIDYVKDDEKKAVAKALSKIDEKNIHINYPVCV